MGDYPDIYADNVVVSANQFGLTLTLLRSEPRTEPGPEAPPNQVVGRVRVSHDLARAITELVTRTLAQAAQAAQMAHQATTEIKH